jgi:outer membrane protein
MKKIVFVVFLLLAFHAKSQQTPSRTFSLPQAIAYALEHNYSAMNTSRDIEIAQKKKWETTATGLPQIDASLNYLNNIVIKKMIFGNNVIPFGTKQSMETQATLSQLLFNGSYLVGLQAAKTYLQYYQNAKIKSNSDIKEMVVNSYGNILLAEESVLILEKNKAALEKTIFEINQMYKNGFVEEENVEQLKITLSTVNSSLNYAKRMQAIAVDLFKINLGISTNDTVVLTDKLENLSMAGVGFALQNTRFEVQKTIDFAMMNNFVQQRSLELKLEKSKALPSLAAALNVGYTGFGDKQFNFLNASQKWFHYSNVGVGLNVPLFSSLGRSARTQQARLELEKAKTQLIEIDQKLKLQYQKAKSDFEFSIEQYTASKNNLDLATRIEKKQSIKYKEGLSSSFDYTEAQKQLYTAQQNYLQSMVDIINKKAALEKLLD